MINKWFFGINRFLLVAIIALGLGAAIYRILSASARFDTEETTIDPAKKKIKNLFELAPEAYNAIKEPIFPLQFSPPVLHLPDLRLQLVYHGVNGRPDARLEKKPMHFSLKGTQAIVSVRPNERLYLNCLNTAALQKYEFSLDNEPSSLWIEPVFDGNRTIVKVFMQNDKGELIREPIEFAEFNLEKKEFMRTGGHQWQIGSWRVDSTLLARQHARWYGKDYFLENHGGEEFDYAIGKQRIDFGRDEEIYSVYVGIGDCLVWENNRWRIALTGEDSVGKPLLAVKKIDDRLITFEIWDLEGKSKVLLNLIKSKEAWISSGPQDIQQVFRFVGARRKSQFIFEVNEDRMLISPNDWLLYTEEGWQKLSTEQEIDDYVQRKTPGLLFIFGEIARKGERQVLHGKLYNTTRSEIQPVELAILQGGAFGPSPPSEEDMAISNEEEMLLTESCDKDKEPRS